MINKEYLEFLKILHLEFEEQRQKLLKDRIKIQSDITISNGKCLKKPVETHEIRSDSRWKVREIPKILEDRSVDIVCLDICNYQTMEDCVKSGSNGVQVDFDDGYSPSWSNNLKAQANIKSIVYDDSLNNDSSSLIIIRPRSMNLDELNLSFRGNVGGVLSGSIFDLSLFLYNNGKKLIERGRGPYLYIPKIENYREAIWWNSLLKRCEQLLGLKQFSIKAIVLIENILASFEMEEIIYYLKDYCIALNTGRWDYIFSYIKKFSELAQYNVPQKSMLGFNQDFLLSYYKLLSITSHKRGCFATGGMAPHFTASSTGLTDKELLSIFNGKRDEAKMGFDGALIAHTSAVKSCRNAFKEVLGINNINHLMTSNGKPLKDFKFSPIECETYYSNLIKVCNFGIDTIERENRVIVASVSTKDILSYLIVLYNYIFNWIYNEKGAIAINGQIEDLATSEINRVLLWKWLKYGVAIKEDNNKPLSVSLIINYLDSLNNGQVNNQKHQTIKTIIIQFLTSNQLIDFMPTLLYPYLLQNNINCNQMQLKSKL